jgi:hypothetical protein
MCCVDTSPADAGERGEPSGACDDDTVLVTSHWAYVGLGLTPQTSQEDGSRISAAFGSRPRGPYGSRRSTATS